MINSPNYFLVKPKNDKRYKNTESVNGTDIIVSNSIEDGLNTNREAVVFQTPIGYDGDVEKGDTLIVHHNTFRLMRNQRGVMVNSMKHVKDDIFYIDNYYLRIDKDGNKHSKFPYLFLNPVVEDDLIYGEKERDSVGVVAFTNPELESMGIKVGNKYLFKDFGKAKYNIEGEYYIRMEYKDLLAII